MKKSIIFVTFYTLLPVYSTMAQENVELCPDENHPHIIDLGLSSGTKWACCNIGADCPEAWGGYYAWGEKEEKETYSEVTYLFASWDNSIGDYVWSDIGESISGTEYDVATKNWGEAWRMPTKEQMEELQSQCTSETYTQNGKKGLLFTGKSGNRIFMPFAGAKVGKKTSYTESYCFCWSGTASTTNASKAYMMRIAPNGYIECLIDGRYYGVSIRPVRTETAKTVEATSNFSPFQDSCYTIYGIKIGHPKSTNKLQKGIYIRNGKKIVIK